MDFLLEEMGSHGRGVSQERHYLVTLLVRELRVSRFRFYCSLKIRVYSSCP